MDELNLLHPERDKRSSVRVLVPGCGLARLPFELAASHGYHSIANEQSYLMLFAGNFILNNCDRRQGQNIGTWNRRRTKANFYFHRFCYRVV